MQRILILTNRVPYPLKDGGNMAMKAMVDGYHSNGYEVYLLSMNTTRHYIDKKEAEKAYSHIYAFEAVDVDNELHVMSTINNFLFSKEANHVMRFRSTDFKQKLHAVLKSFEPDFVQIESIYLSTYLNSIGSGSRAKTILRLHNIEYQVWERLANETKQPLKKYYLNNLAKRIKKFEESAWSKYDLLLPITNEDEEKVKRVLPTIRLHTVPYTIKSTNSSAVTEEKWVGYHIGAMDWLPNVEGINWFLDGWQEISKTAPDFNFYYAGRNMPESFKEKEIDGVICEGEVEDAQAFISDKKILIVPIRSGGGIRVKILEAMSQGKVVISTQIGIQGIDAEPGKHYLAANTIKEFSIQIQWVLDNKSQAEGISQKAKELIYTKYDSKSVYKGLSHQLAAMK